MSLEILTGDITVSKEEFKREMETLLLDNGKLNSVTQTMINKIIDLYDTARSAKEEIEKYGVLLEEYDGNQNIKFKPNPAVAMQSSAISNMSKLIAQLELDTLEHDDGGDDL